MHNLCYKFYQIPGTGATWKSFLYSKDAFLEHLICSKIPLQSWLHMPLHTLSLVLCWPSWLLCWTGCLQRCNCWGDSTAASSVSHCLLLLPTKLLPTKLLPTKQPTQKSATEQNITGQKRQNKDLKTNNKERGLEARKTLPNYTQARKRYFTQGRDKRWL